MVSVLAFTGFSPEPALAGQYADLGTTLSLQLDDGASVVGPPTVQDISTGSYTPSGSTTPITGLPPFCRVALDISSTGDASQSQIWIEVWLPEVGWNGRYLGTGNGGFAGAIDATALAGGLLQGYAVANTDMGTGILYHCNALFCGGRSGLGGPPAGLNGHPDSIKDFGYRATHLMTVAAK
jgi:feruloyl esterase